MNRRDRTTRTRTALDIAAALLTATLTLTALLTLTAISGTRTTPGTPQPPTTPPTFELIGTLTLHAPCTPTPGYTDIHPGTTITLYNPDNRIIGTGTLDTPRTTTPRPTGCTYRIHIPNVPKHHRFYQLEISHRGRITVTEDQAVSGVTALTLGSPR